MRRVSRAVLVAAVFLACPTGPTHGQPAPRRLTTIEALRQFPGFFHLQNVVLRGEFAESGSRVSLRADERLLGVMLNNVKSLSGPVEVRGELIDVGRLEPGDPRLAGDSARDSERWPRPGEELVLIVAAVSPAERPIAPSVRAVALEPWRYEGQSVSVVGQFRGRNLFGDLPGAPAKSNYDFVIRAADGAVWVTGIRPRGKGFDLSVNARVDTNQWVQVTGIVRHERGLVTMEGSAITAAKAPAPEPVSDEPPVVKEPPSPVEVVFSQPTDNDTDFPVDGIVRVQFSKGLNPATLQGQIRGGYVGQAGRPGQDQPPPVEIRVTYDVGTRGVEIKFSRPLERFRTFKLEFLEGIKGFDGGPLKPWTLTFSTGG